jgi:hypothetical protein
MNQRWVFELEAVFVAFGVVVAAFGPLVVWSFLGWFQV